MTIGPDFQRLQQRPVFIAFEAAAGVVVFLVSLIIYPQAWAGDLALQAAVFTAIILLRFRPVLAVLPLMAASVLAVTGVGEHLLLSSYLVYLAVEFAVTRGRLLIAAILTGQWFLLAYFFHRGFSLTADDLPAVVVDMLFLAAAVTVGSYRCNNARQQLRIAESQEAVQQELRDNIARYLHDSLARGLTIATMRADLLGMKSADPEIQRELATLADTNREALEDIRHLVAHLVREDRSKAAESIGLWKTASVGETINSTVGWLQSAGFPVLRRLPADLLNPEARLTREVETAFALALSELTANAVNHSPMGAQVILDISREDNFLLVGVTNERRSTASSRPGNGLGISSVNTRMRAIGGDAEFSITPAMWTAQLTLPLDDAEGFFLPNPDLLDSDAACSVTEKDS